MAAEISVVSRDQVEKFLRSSIDIICSSDTRRVLADPSSGKPGAKLVEIQKQVWADLGVSPEAGRSAIGSIAKFFPEDSAALVSLRDEFGNSNDSVYLQCLEDRRPTKLKRSGKLQRETILAFFDACNTKLDMPEVRKRLNDQIEETGSLPDAVTNEVHDEVMELLGVERTYGQACFKDLGESQELNKDRDLAIGYARWRGKTVSVCLHLLREYQKKGGELHVDQEVKDELIHRQAQEELETMSPAERAQVLKSNIKKIKVLQGLPVEARAAWLGRLSDEAKVEISKCEYLIEAIGQSQESTKTHQ